MLRWSSAPDRRKRCVLIDAKSAVLGFRARWSVRSRTIFDQFAPGTAISAAKGPKSFLQVAGPSDGPSDAFPARTCNEPARLNGVRHGTANLVVVFNMSTMRNNFHQKPLLRDVDQMKVSLKLFRHGPLTNGLRGSNE